MAKKAKNTEVTGEEADAKPARSKKMMILTVVGAIVLFVAGGKVQGGGKTKTVVKVVYTTTTLPMGPVVTLDAITLNLVDGHLLKVGIALQLEAPDPKAPAVARAEGGAAADSTDSTKGYARALDIAIEELGKHTIDELAGEGRSAAKEELVKRLEKAYHGEIVDVYFHQFVMQ